MIFGNLFKDVVIDPVAQATPVPARRGLRLTTDLPRTLSET
jgi:hypothetical protein